MNWTLVAVLAILALGAIIGAWKGLIKMVYSFAIVLVVTIITTIFAPKLAAYLKSNTTWDDSLKTSTEKFLLDQGILKQDAYVDISELPVPSSIREKIEAEVKDVSGMLVEKYNAVVVEAVSSVIFSCIVYIAFFIICMILASIIGMLLDIVAKLPVLKQLNKTAGAIVGLALGLIIVWILGALVTMLGNFKIGATISDNIDSNAFLKFIYDKNLIMEYVTRFLGK